MFLIFMSGLLKEHCKVLTDEELEQYIREQEKELDEE